MKTLIIDSNTLYSIQPLNVSQYLRVHGWQQQRATNVASYWTTFDEKGDEYEVGVPLDPYLGDFALRMSEAMNAIATRENRAQTEILTDLRTTSADLIRLKANGDGSKDGSLSLNTGVKFFEASKALIGAAACAALSPKAAYGSRRPKAVSEYMRKVRLGQTERSSFVVTLISPVTPDLTSLSGSDVDPDPFERRVTLTLVNSLQAADSAATQAAATGNFESFNNAISLGVSANLCDALDHLFDGCDESIGLEMNVSWAPNRPTAGAPRRVAIRGSARPYFAEAARLLRDMAPLENFELEGPVIRLHREEGSDHGLVTVAAKVQGKLRSVEIILGDEHYRQAVQAHGARIPICCVGELGKKGSTTVLSNAREFQVLPLSST